MPDNRLTVSGQNSVVSANEYIGLVKTTLDTINSSHPVTKLAYNFVRWLGREGIDESDFQYCVEQSRAVAYPNEQGLEIRQSILQSENKIARAGGLHLIAAGAIGRWMAFSQDHTYMVTTVATATKYQGMDFASKLLCEMVLANKDESVEDDKNYYAYSVERTRLMGVLSKVVGSISLNVVNAGHKLGDLPEDLRSLCVHLVDAPTFARIILKISRSNTDILLLSDRFQGDILLWVLSHFEGSIEVSVAGKHSFRRDSLHGTRHFIMMVKAICEEGCRQTCHKVELSELLGDSWTRTLAAQDCQTMKISTAQRLSLYTIEPPDFSRRRDILNMEELDNVKSLARMMVSWMMDIPIKNNPEFNSLGFETAFSLEPADVQIRIGDLLYRWPELLHSVSAEGTDTPRTLAFTPPDAGESQGSDVFYESETERLSALCGWFPDLASLLSTIADRCKCRICRNKGSIDDCKEGCLREAALSRIFVLIGNAVADGFGVKDASGITDLEAYTYEVRRLLTDLGEGFVWWDKWFNIAASTALGYFTKGVIGSGYLDEGGTALVAVQYGSNVVAAKWLDLTQKLSVHQCFALEMAEGQISGVKEELVCLHSEVKMKLSCDISKAIVRLPTDTYELWQGKIAERDESVVKLEHAIFGSHDPMSSRLLTIAIVGSSMRIIDPADALLGIFRSRLLKPAKCNRPHSHDLAWSGNEDDLAWYLWSLNDLLTNWEADNQGMYFTNTLDTPLTVNIALSLSVNGCVLRDTRTCLSCTLEVLQEYPNMFGSRIITSTTDEQALVRR